MIEEILLACWPNEVRTLPIHLIQCLHLDHYYLHITKQHLLELHEDQRRCNLEDLEGPVDWREN